MSAKLTIVRPHERMLLNLCRKLGYRDLLEASPMEAAANKLIPSSEAKDLGLLPVLPKEAVQAMLNDYQAFRRAFEQGDIEQQRIALDDYRQKVRANEATYKVSSKAKYYSSILEEVLVLLMTPHLEKWTVDTQRCFFLGPLNAVIRYYRDGKVHKLSKEHKGIDCAFAVQADDGDWITLLGIEAKKYLDKVMEETVQSVKSRLQELRPSTEYIVVMEDEARSKDARENSRMFGSEYILTKKGRNRAGLNPIHPKTWARFVTELIERTHRQYRLVDGIEEEDED